MTIQDESDQPLPPPYAPSKPNAVKSFEVASNSDPYSSFERDNPTSFVPIATIANPQDWNQHIDTQNCDRKSASQQGFGAHTTVAHEAMLFSKSSNPPGNCLDGGQWGKVNYAGNKTGALACVGFLVCGLPGLFILGCPQDSKDAYLCEGKVYDASGKCLGLVSRSNFVPSRNHNQVRNMF